MPVAKRSKVQRNVKPVNGALSKIVAKIQGLQVEFLKCLGDAITYYLQIGNELARAKTKLGRGEWNQLLTETGFNRRTAERLVQLSTTSLAKKTRTRGTHLGRACTPDLQKIISLARLPDDRLDQGLKTIDLTASRKRVAEQVNLLLNPNNADSDPEAVEDDDAEYEDQANEHGGEQDADDATEGQNDDASNNEQAEDDDAEDADDADEDEASDPNAESSEETSDDDEQQTDEGYDDEETEEPSADEQNGQHPLWQFVEVVQQLGDELVDSAIEAIGSAAYDLERLGDVVVAVRTGRSRLWRVLQAIEAAQTATANGGS